MRFVSDKAKIFYLIIFIFFISGFGLFWMDYIGLIDLNEYTRHFREEPASVLNTTGDEPTLVEREEFEKEKLRLQERIEDLDRREAMISEKEKDIVAEREKMQEIRKGLELERRKLEMQQKQYSGYQKNVKKLADKINSMPPKDAVGIMVGWEDTLIIDVLRQMDSEAEKAGKASITSYLLTQMPKDKASRIMYLMTQL